MNASLVHMKFSDTLELCNHVTTFTERDISSRITAVPTMEKRLYSMVKQTNTYIFHAQYYQREYMTVLEVIKAFFLFIFECR